MINITVKSMRNIGIELEPGVYTFDNESATGKTFLYKMLEKQIERTDILCLNPSSSKILNKLSNVSFIDKVDLIFMDRYDLMNGKYADEIRELHKEKVILLDCKHNQYFDDIAKSCYIDMDEKDLRVVCYDYI